MTNKVRQYFVEKCKVVLWRGQKRQCPLSVKREKETIEGYSRTRTRKSIALLSLVWKN